jgi:site-specific DNA recombinase
MIISETNQHSAVLYLRAASADPQDQRLAISEQRTACAREAERLGANVVGEYVDAGASGNTGNRSGLRGLLGRIVQHPVLYVIVRDRLRLARNPADDGAIRARLDKAGVTLVAADGDAERTRVDELLRGIR